MNSVEKPTVGARRRAARHGGALRLSLLLAVQPRRPFAGPNEQAQAHLRAHRRRAAVSRRCCRRWRTTSPASRVRRACVAAAALATDHADAPTFYDVTLKNLIIPWTNRDQSVFAPLNDYAATVIGMVRDDVPFNTALSADILYTVNAPGLPAPSTRAMTHYATAEANGVDLSDRAQADHAVGDLRHADRRDRGPAHHTRRAPPPSSSTAPTARMFRFTMINHLCNDMQTLMDTTRPTDRIRQDVARSPGGDSRVFLNNCVGCHSGMDPMAQAFAYYNFKHHRPTQHGATRPDRCSRST